MLFKHTTSGKLVIARATPTPLLGLELLGNDNLSITQSTQYFLGILNTLCSPNKVFIKIVLSTSTSLAAGVKIFKSIKFMNKG